MYTENGTMLANFLKEWMRTSNLKYNYNKRKFVTTEAFEEFLGEQRDEDLQQAYCDATIMYPGLSEEGYEKIQDRYIREVDKMGWEYEDRPMLNATERQCKRSLKFRQRERKHGY